MQEGMHAKSLDTGCLGATTRRWIRERPQSRRRTEISFKLLILFLLMLYPTSPCFQTVGCFRPVLLVAVAAIAMMVIELARRGSGFDWRGRKDLLLAFLGIAAIRVQRHLCRQAFTRQRTFQKSSDLSVDRNTVTTEKRLRSRTLTCLIGGIFPAFWTSTIICHGIIKEGTRAAWKGIFGINENAYAR